MTNGNQFLREYYQPFCLRMTRLLGEIFDLKVCVRRERRSVVFVPLAVVPDFGTIWCDSMVYNFVPGIRTPEEFIPASENTLNGGAGGVRGPRCCCRGRSTRSGSNSTNGILMKLNGKTVAASHDEGYGGIGRLRLILCQEDQYDEEIYRWQSGWVDFV